MKKKIAFISEHASPLATLGGVDSGGQNVYVGELARHLTVQDYQVDIYTRWDNDRLPEVVTWVKDVRIIHIEAGPKTPVAKEKLLPHMDEFTSRMLEFIARHEHQYELIHANFFMSASVAADIKKILGIPFVVTFHALGSVRKIHQGSSDRFPKSRIAIERRIVQECDHIIGECPQDKDDLIEHYNAPSNKITIIPCGFNSYEFYPIDRLLARMVLNIDTTGPIILQLGRMVPRKGVDNVIRALGKLTGVDPFPKLIIVGGENDEASAENSPEIARLMKIADEEGVAEHVCFAGRKNRDILKYYYSSADIFVTTPWYEPFGITPLESMACGTPVVGSRVGGIKYSVEDGKTGFLVPPENPEALAEKLKVLLEDKSLLQEMSAHALKRVHFYFTWTKVSQQMAALYERVLDHNGQRYEEESRLIDKAFESAIRAFQQTRKNLTVELREAASLLCAAFRKGRKVLICGNGGSAAESQHFAAELVGRFEMPDRPGLPAIALTADSAVTTAWSNDFSYEDVFSRQVEALGQKGDVLFCFSTSGMSSNLIAAMRTALDKGLTCIALTGKGGGDLISYAHVNMIVPLLNTQRIQELHLHILHTLCSLIESKLFGNILPSGTLTEVNALQSNGNGHHKSTVS